MILDEAIKHAEEVMAENIEKTKDRNASDPISISCGECADNHRQLAEWLRELQQLREQTRWIPVSEGLPEDAFGCLVTVEEDDIYGEPQSVIFPEFVGYDGETWNNADGEPIPFDVVAWMPLPESYRAESEEGEIKVGDEVRRIGSDPERDDCDFGICLMKNSRTIYVMRADGSTGEEDIECWYKTGRHFDQIEEVLNAMKE